MSGIGHNKGPTMEPGGAWRRYAWRRSREELLPKLPLEIVRLRVRRARELGLDYKTYAGVRAATGRDLVAFLFSSNALRVMRDTADMPQDVAAKLGAVARCERIAFAQPPVDPARLGAHEVIDFAARAPGLAQSWSDVRRRVLSVTAERGLPADAVLVIGDTALEREWREAGRLAGLLPSERYFKAG